MKPQQADHAKICEALRELSDKECQRCRWLCLSGSEMSSFTEAVCSLFDDSGLGTLLEKVPVAFTEEIDAQFRKLAETVTQFDDSRAPSACINDPRMDTIRALAGELLAKLKERLRDQTGFSCPCCGCSAISNRGEHEICTVCNWEDDPVQSEHPDLTGGANELSLKQARQAYKTRTNDLKQ